MDTEEQLISKAMSLLAKRQGLKNKAKGSEYFRAIRAKRTNYPKHNKKMPAQTEQA